MRGDRVVEKRKAKRLSQQDLADSSGVSMHTIFRAEKGNDVHPQNLQKIARGLDTSVAYLIGETDDPAPPEERTSPQEGQPSRRPRRSRAAEDAEAIVVELLRKNPDLAVSFRNVRSNWNQLSDKDIEALALGLQWSLGVADAKINDRLKTTSRDGEL